jgi:hypothetical protein
LRGGVGCDQGCRHGNRTLYNSHRLLHSVDNAVYRSAWQTHARQRALRAGARSPAQPIPVW